MKGDFFEVNAAGEATRLNGKTYFAPDPHDHVDWPGKATDNQRHLRRVWQRRLRAMIARREGRDG